MRCVKKNLRRRFFSVEVCRPVPHALRGVVKHERLGFAKALSCRPDQKGSKHQVFCLINGSIAQLGEHLPYKQRVTGSSPVVPTKKEVTFVYQKLLLFLSKPQAWHIITRQRVYHRRRRISSARGCINCSLMRCNASH